MVTTFQQDAVFKGSDWMTLILMLTVLSECSDQSRSDQRKSELLLLYGERPFAEANAQIGENPKFLKETSA